MARRGGTSSSGKPRPTRPKGRAVAADPPPLTMELATYRAKLPELLDSEGRFVLVHGEVVEGIFATRAEALEAGYLKHGAKPFLVKEIRAEEPIRYFTRDLG